MRIYFEGSNSPNCPWKISDEIDAISLKTSMTASYKHITFLSKLIADINAISSYNKYSSFFQRILTVYYYPLSKFIDDIMRKKKADEIRNLFIQKTQVNSPSFRKFKLSMKWELNCMSILYTKLAA
jgi:hypothetical protein